MNISISADSKELGMLSAKFISHKLKSVISEKGKARMVVSTGSSQFDMFEALVGLETDWTKVEIFHLDEYIDLPATHPASFRKYLRDRFIRHIAVKKFHSIDIEGDPKKIISELTSEIRKAPIDLGVIGIGVNGHIAFNDPPADFTTREAFKIVNLDEVCRMQQVGEGWFAGLNDVPERAVSMTVFQIMQCQTIVSCVPHAIKADAIFKTLSNSLTNMVPATMLKQHPDFYLYLDKNSASRIIVL
jgi:glucosamine-6-phosphate deaminase